MYSLNTDVDPLERLRKRFEDLRVADRCGSTLDEILRVANPANGLSLKPLQKKLNYTTQGTIYFYDRWCGPAIPDFPTAKARHKGIFEIRQRRRIQHVRAHGVPDPANSILQIAQSNGCAAEPVMWGKLAISTTSLVINGFRSKILTRAKEFCTEGSFFIPFSVRPQILNEYDFIIVRWENDKFPDFPSGVYIFPTKLLKRFMLKGAKDAGFYIPLHKAALQARRVRINWEYYRNNWHQFKRKAAC